MSNDLSESVSQWMIKAEEDWEAVQIMAAHSRPPFSLVCFHCQQYIEKLLKALLTKNGIEAPHTHNLRRLIQLVESYAPRLTLLTDLSDALSAHGVLSRYPDETYIADSLEMRRMIKAAQELSEIIFIALTEDSKK